MKELRSKKQINKYFTKVSRSCKNISMFTLGLTVELNKEGKMPEEIKGTMKDTLIKKFKQVSRLKGKTPDVYILESKRFNTGRSFTMVIRGIYK